jgi:hypothetical protein
MLQGNLKYQIFLNTEQQNYILYIYIKLPSFSLKFY